MNRRRIVLLLCCVDSLSSFLLSPSPRHDRVLSRVDAVAKKPAFADPLPLERDVSRLQKGQIIRDGVARSIAFEGKKGAKLFVDVGAYREEKNGTKRRIVGMLNLPREASLFIEGKMDSKTRKKIPNLAKVCDMLRSARTDPSSNRITCYVSKARPDSAQLVLTPFKPPPAVDDSWRDIENVRVGDEINEGTIAKVGMKTCVIFARVHRNNRPCPGVVRLRTVPTEVAFATAPSLKESTTKVLRAGMSLGPAWVRKVEPQSGRYELSMTPVDKEALEDERRSARDRRREMGAKKRVTQRLKVGDRVEGSVVKVLTYGAVVDFGASATGLVMRDNYDVDQLNQLRGQDVTCLVAAIQPRLDRPNSPRITLQLLIEEEEDDYEPLQPPLPSYAVADARASDDRTDTGDQNVEQFEVDEEYEEYEDEDEEYGYDDIEESLGLDSY